MAASSVELSKSRTVASSARSGRSLILELGRMRSKAHHSQVHIFRRARLLKTKFQRKPAFECYIIAKASNNPGEEAIKYQELPLAGKGCACL